MRHIQELLENNSYPGRGIVAGLTNDGKKAVIAYFIMGRSENSRNRIFVAVDDDLKTQAYDESKLTDPSLIIYAPVRVIGDETIVTNGDQTDTIYNSILRGEAFEDALRTRCFEPDSPNFTPRISAILNISDVYTYKMSILKSNDGDNSECLRFFYEYEKPIPGQGHFIHTYKCDDDPIPSFEGEPISIEIDDDDIHAFANTIWDNLNYENKVSLFVRMIDLESQENDTIIMNKNESF